MARVKSNTTGARFARLFQPVLDALRALGGSGRPNEVKDWISEHVHLDRDYLTAVHDKSGESVFGNDVDWARFYMVRAGFIDSSRRGVWTLTEQGRQQQITAERATQIIREVDRSVQHVEPAPGTAQPPPATNGTIAYRGQAIETLKDFPPRGFENLAQRVLRESGFEEVHVTGRSGDGGIDGHGILKVNVSVSFRVLFQCKCWNTAVGADVVRDFRGAMVGRADKGIIITTGHFTPQAEREASRDGARPIELVDGDGLVDILAQLELGLRPTTTYEIDDSFFSEFRSPPE